MGPIVERSLETLAPSDIAVVRARRLILRTLEAFQSGQRPPGADQPQCYAGVRGGYYTTNDTGDWLQSHKAKVASAPAHRMAMA